MSLKIFPYNYNSLSARKLSKALRIQVVGHTYSPLRNNIIINWGNSTPPHFKWMEQDLNKPHAIALASNKLNTFLEYRNASFIHVPDWTTNPQEAQHILNLGNKVYCRKLLSSHSGNGIVICKDGDKLPIAPLYTFHTKHKDEYRVHVFKGRSIDVQKKKKRKNNFISNGIRNSNNGWVYCRGDIIIPTNLQSIAVEAVGLLGLDFGAVDIGHRVIDNKFFVFEVNTAPGLEKTTLDKYAKAIYNYSLTL